MRGKIVNNAVYPIDYDKELEKINHNYNEDKKMFNVTDDVIQKILKKDVEKYTDDEVRLIAIRKSLDDDYNEKKSKLDEYLPIVEIPYRGEVPEYHILVPTIIKNNKVLEKHYEVQLDSYGVETKIRELKKRLQDTDYIIIKTYEARLLNETDPYDDISEIASERKKIREQINQLEDLLKTE